MRIVDKDFRRLAYNLIVVELGIGGYFSGRVELNLVGRCALGFGLYLQLQSWDIQEELVTWQTRAGVINTYKQCNKHKT